MGFPRTSLLPLMVLAALVAFPGCFVPDKKMNASLAVARGSGFKSTTAGATGLAAFKSTLQPLVLQKCAACHGVNQSPRFAVSSADDSYNTILSAGLVDFSNIANSKLVRKRGDGHCGGACAGDATDFKNAIQAWWDGGQCRQAGVCGAGPTDPGGGGTAPPAPGGASKPPLATSNQLLPANLPTDATYTTLTWNLVDIDPTLTGAKFLVDVQLLAGSNAYQLRKPRITIPAAQTYSIYVRELTVWINGVVDSNATTYSVIERTVSQPGGQNLSSSTMIVLRDKGPGSDQLSIAFGQLEKSASACKSLAMFTSKVRPVMNVKCVGCHANQSVFRLNSADTDDVVCLRALQRVDFGHPTQSQLITLPRSGGARRDGSPHDPTTLNDADVTSWLEWIAGEAP